MDTGNTPTSGSTGYSAVYSRPAPSTPPSATSCPGGGCPSGGEGGFTSLPQLYNAFPQNPLSPPASGNNSGMQMIPQWNQPMPVNPENLQYLNGFLRTQIGRKVKVEFLIGTSTLSDRIGVLVGVGANYILLNEIETDDLLACDFYNIKFIRFYY